MAEQPGCRAWWGGGWFPAHWPPGPLPLVTFMPGHRPTLRLNRALRSIRHNNPSDLYAASVLNTDLGHASSKATESEGR
ncbi:hypothetical protein ACJ73_05185 [Blastomyces percursus]|uniref:Uncharacterized protein n=1 Tax=Blastomyces percursus TaxID=1658174 RepID=A0A1J9R741_9EURO|nr:hypothetical protein ACJ73_05185 [Blastomyces percursus]